MAVSEEFSCARVVPGVEFDFAEGDVAFEDIALFEAGVVVGGEAGAGLAAEELEQAGAAGIAPEVEGRDAGAQVDARGVGSADHVGGLGLAGFGSVGRSRRSDRWLRGDLVRFANASGSPVSAPRPRRTSLDNASAFTLLSLESSRGRLGSGGPVAWDAMSPQPAADRFVTWGEFPTNACQSGQPRLSDFKVSSVKSWDAFDEASAAQGVRPTYEEVFTLIFTFP